MVRLAKVVAGSVAIADMTDEAIAAVLVLATIELVAPAGAASVVGSGASSMGQYLPGMCLQMN